MKTFKPYLQKTVRFLHSKKFFYVIVGLLCLQALWIAFSSRYPMAFDEEYHFGLIKLYSEHMLPFWTGQPAGADSFGAVYRDPSYLYHYVLSFPYKLIAAATDSQSAQVLLLRIINIGMFASGLYIFRRLFRAVGASYAQIHVLFLLFVLIPVVPLLAGQINYDNVFIPLVALLFLWIVRYLNDLKRYKRINSQLFLQMTALSLFASLIKYPFLPFAAAAFLLLLAATLHQFKSFKYTALTFLFGLTLMTKRLRWLLVLLIVIGSFLFAERYAVNLIRYHSPAPDCAAALSEERCRSYGPWNRDNFLKNTKTHTPTNPVTYSEAWLNGMWMRLFFAVDGPASGYQTRGPLTVPALSAIYFSLASSALLIFYAAKVFRRHPLLLPVFAICVFYIAILWLDGFEAYRRTSKPVAINGRYLLPVLPVLLLAGIFAWQQLLLKRSNLKLAAATAAVLCMTWGGGTLTFILRSSDNWYWNNQFVRTVNGQVREAVAPFVPGSDKPVQYLP